MVKEDVVDGCGLPSCIINPPTQQISGNPKNTWELINSNPYYAVYWPWLIFPQNEPCLGNLGCWGGIDYAHNMVRVNSSYFNEVSKVTGDISNMSGYMLDYYEKWSGLKISPKIGFGLDAYKQWSDDAQRGDLTLLQRTLRAGVVGVEGIGVSAASSVAGNAMGENALALSFEPAVQSGQLWLPPVAYWGGFTVGYGATNVTLSVVTDYVNGHFLFPLIKNLP